jgi:hypothetical protein
MISRVPPRSGQAPRPNSSCNRQTFWIEHVARHAASSHVVRAIGYPGSAHERTAVRVPGPPSRQPRDHRTVPQGKSWHALACKRWVSEGGTAGKWRSMTERKLSATDAALRKRLSELCAHIPCGGRTTATAEPALPDFAYSVAVVPRRGFAGEVGGMRRLPGP